MIDNFVFSANAVLPIFFIIAFGFFLRYKGFISQRAIAEMNGLVFSFALPLLLFRNIYRADFSALFDIWFILWILASVTICFALLWCFAKIYLKTRKELIGAFVQVTLRANYAIVGLPLVANMMGGNDTGLAAFTAAFVVASFNILSVIVLSSEGAEKGGQYGKLFLSIFRNPSIIGIMLAVAVNLLNIPLPQIAKVSIDYMAVLCTPMALIAAGGAIQISEIMKYIRPALIASAAKIIVIPIIFVTASVFLGFNGEPLAVIFAIFANPAAVMCYVMAARMNANTAITSAVILITTLFSSVTLTVGVYILKTMELI